MFSLFNFTACKNGYYGGKTGHAFAPQGARHVNLLSSHVVAMLVGLDPTVVLVFVKLVNIIQHFFTQGRTQWRTPPRFDLPKVDVTHPFGTLGTPHTNKDTCL